MPRQRFDHDQGSLCRDREKMMLRHSSLLLEGFIVTIEIFVSRQRITIKAKPVSRQIFYMSQHKVLDVGAFYVTTGNGHNKGFVVAIEALCHPRQS